MEKSRQADGSNRDRVYGRAMKFGKVRGGARGEIESVVVLLLVLLALLGGATWWLYSSRARSEEAARQFASEASIKLAAQYDRKFFDTHIAREVQTRFPPSYRERLLNHLQEFGIPSAAPEVHGDVTFASHFFSPQGRFRVHLVYPTTTADMDLLVSNPKGWWQIDYVNLTWYPPPPPPPEPSPSGSPSVTASPTPTARAGGR
jgi:type II secretory pathway pseudopilin PulG